MANKSFSNVKVKVTHLDLSKDASRSVLVSGENISHSLGKIARWYKDIAWTGHTHTKSQITDFAHTHTSLDSSVDKGAENQPVYFVKGVPTAIAYTIKSSVPENAVFTDTNTKVTAVGNHYTPSGGTTTSASGGTLTDITNSANGVQVVTGVTKDAAGHVTGVTSIALKSVNSNTTYAAGTGISMGSGNVINHSNSITAVTTAAFKKFKYDAQGHITGTADVVAADLPSHTHSQYLTAHQSLDGRAINTTIPTNLNSATTPGFYNAQGGNTSTNKPTSDIDHYGLMTVHNAAGSYYTQIAFSDSKDYIRRCVNGTWGAWSEVKFTDTVYTHPSYTSKTSGLYKITVDATGHISGTAAVAAADLPSHTHSYLPLSGGTLTGGLTLVANQYAGNSKFGIDCKNSDIINANVVQFGDLADSADEGLQFYRDGTKLDVIWVKNGVMYFTPNHTQSSSSSDTNYTVYHSGNLTLSTLGGAASSHTHGLLHDSHSVSVDSTTNTWSAIGINGNGYVLKSIRTNTNAPAYLLNDFSAGIAFGGADTRGVISMSYNQPQMRFAGGNRTAQVDADGNPNGTAVWYFTVKATHNQTYTLPSTGGTLALVGDNNHSHAYLPTAGGTMTGDITFTGVTSTTYPASSKAIKFSGSTDGANIFYRVNASDQGELVIQTTDDSNCYVKIENSHASAKNTIKFDPYNSYIYANYFNAGCSAETPTTSSYIIYANSDGWLRKSTLANVKTILGLGSAAYTASSDYATAGHTHRVSGTSTDGANTNWTAFGIKDYNNAYPDGMTLKKYGWGEVISFGGTNGRLDLYVNHNSTNSDAGYKSNGMQYRSGWADDKKAWRMILDNVNYSSYITPAEIGAAASSHTHSYAKSESVNGPAYSVAGTQGTTEAYRHVWFSVDSDDTRRAYADNFKYEPALDTLKFGAWYPVDITGQTVNLNDYTDGSGKRGYRRYICKTTGGGANISNKPSDSPFVLEVILIRFATVSTDFIAKQIYHSYNKKTYQRFCVNNTWDAWSEIKTTDTVYTHPSHTAASSGLYKITVNSLGHVTAATAVTKADITALGIPGSDTNTNDAVTQSATTTTNYRPILTGATNVGTSGTGLDATITGGAYASNMLFVQPSSGRLYARNLVAYDKDGGDVIVEWNRSGNASWRMLNTGGNLYLQCNYTTAKTDYYSAAKFNYNKGAVELYTGTLQIGNSDKASAGISFKTTNYTGAYLRVYDTGNAYNHDVVLNSTGSVMIGAGESASAIYTNNVESIKNSENMALSADGDIFIYTGANTLNARKRFKLTQSGNFGFTGMSGDWKRCCFWDGATGGTDSSALAPTSALMRAGVWGYSSSIYTYFISGPDTNEHYFTANTYGIFAGCGSPGGAGNGDAATLTKRAGIVGVHNGKDAFYACIAAPSSLSGYVTCTLPSTSGSMTDIAYQPSAELVRHCRAVHDASDVASKPWHKVASINVGGTYQDRTAVFLVTARYLTRGGGILVAHVRTTGTAGTAEAVSLRWIVRSSQAEFNSDRFQIRYTNSTGSSKNEVTVEIWCKIETQYFAFEFDLISANDRHTTNGSHSYWTLNSDTTGSASYTAGTGGSASVIAKIANNSSQAIGAKSANGYYGMTDPDLADNVWIRTTSQGIIPYQSGGAGSGHGSIGTSTWYFANAYIDAMHGTADRATNSNNCKTTVTDPSSSTSYGIVFVADPATSEDNTLRKSNDFRINHFRGAANTEGLTELVLGNATAKTAANNSTGRLTLYNANGIYVHLNSGSATSGVDINLPSSGGTMTNVIYKTAKTVTAVSNTGWTNNATDDNIVPTMSFMAFWNGRYNGSSSNLQYCNRGAFGTIVTAGVGDYVKVAKVLWTGTVATTARGERSYTLANKATGYNIIKILYTSSTMSGGAAGCLEINGTKTAVPQPVVVGATATSTMQFYFKISSDGATITVGSNNDVITITGIYGLLI